MEPARAEGQAPHGRERGQQHGMHRLTPAEPADLEEAYALGELYAVHTLRPNENQPSQ